MSLSSALRLVAAVAPIVGTLEWAILGWPLLPPFLFALLLLSASYAAKRWERPVAWTLLPLCWIPPLGAVRAYLAGEHDLWVIPVFDTLLLGWLFLQALAAVRRSGSRT